jgi:two-component system, cell cycle sensor histidine kinase and response regulator CckA
MGLAESERLYQSVIRAMSEGVVVHAADGSIRMANPSAEHILGVTVDQMTGRSPLDPRWQLVRSDGSPLPPDEIPSEITRRTGIPCKNHVVGVHRPTGELAWVSVNTDPVGPAGQPNLPVVATLTDITAERRTKAELEQSRAHLRRLVDAVPGVVFQYLRPTHGQERFPFISARAHEVFGVTAESGMADPLRIWEHIHPDDVSRLVEGLQESASQLSPWQADFRSGDEHGGYRWLRGSSIPERTHEGILWTGVLLDTDQQRKLEGALQVAQRREAMADLASGIAHNFNNLLAVILPNLDIAIENAGDALAEELGDARDAAKNARALVQQLLALTRQDAPATGRDAADLGEVVRDVARICRHTFDRSIAIVERVAPRELVVVGKASLLHQLVLNLCVNARDALAGKDAPRIELSVDESHDPSGTAHVLLRVTDNGIGMAPPTLARIGEPFFTTKGPGLGTGLGLASVYGTARELGGRVDVVSAPGAGTTFTVALPAAALPPTKRSSERPPALDVVPQRVLVIDDEEPVRVALRRMLRRCGKTVVEAGSGREALRLLEADGAFDAIVLDLSLPELPGTKVLTELRRSYPAVPVVVLSGHVDRALSLEGARAVLEKPVSGSELARLLSSFAGAAQTDR